jgi:hypothetical protein
MLNGTPHDRAEIDDLVGRFFATFTNAGGAVPDLESLGASSFHASLNQKRHGNPMRGC